MFKRLFRQRQTVEGGSTAIQTGRDLIVNTTGLSYSEVREVALDVFRLNFYELAGPAKEAARARAEEITEDFLRKLQKENPTGLSSGQDPDFQHALFSVQKQYARTGDKNLGDLLVDLLVDRSKQERRDILQIVLNESLDTAPKLTEEHLAVLAVVFLFRYTRQNSLGTHQLLGEYLDKHLLPFVDKLAGNDATFQHLEFAGCGSIQEGSCSLESVFEQKYIGLFLKGIDAAEARGTSIGLDDRFFTRCLNDGAKVQVRSLYPAQLEEYLDFHGLEEGDKHQLRTLFNSSRMNEAELKAVCISIRPYMRDVFEVWNTSSMKSFSLTSVGMAIGHANIKRLTGEFAPLSQWIN